jgi:hypothetical protein
MLRGNSLETKAVTRHADQVVRPGIRSAEVVLNPASGALVDVPNSLILELASGVPQLALSMGFDQVKEFNKYRLFFARGSNLAWSA